MSDTVKVARLPLCDVCKQRGQVVDAKYDGKTIFGPWANMCERDWREVGVGKLGTGFGQKLEVG